MKYQFKLDVPAQAGYVRLTEAPIERTVRFEAATVLVDYDANGEPVGIELLNTSDKPWSLK